MLENQRKLSPGHSTSFLIEDILFRSKNNRPNPEVYYLNICKKLFMHINISNT
jgi:hypothetical protein